MNTITKIALGTAFALIASNGAFASGVTHNINANTNFQSGFDLGQNNTLALGENVNIAVGDNSALHGKITGDATNEINIADGKKITVDGGLSNITAGVVYESETKKLTKDSVEIATFAGDQNLSSYSSIGWTSFVSKLVVIKGNDVELTTQTAPTFFEVSGATLSDAIWDSTTHNKAENAIVFDEKQTDAENKIDVLLDYRGLTSDLTIQPKAADNKTISASLVGAAGTSPSIIIAQTDGSNREVIFTGDNSQYKNPIKIENAEVKFGNVYSTFNSGISFLNGPGKLTLEADAAHSGVHYQLQNGGDELHFETTGSQLEVNHPTTVTCKLVL